MEKEKDGSEVPYDLQELIESLLQKQLEQDIYIKCLSVFMKLVLKEVCPEKAEGFHKTFLSIVESETEKIKADNVFLNRSLNKRIREELKGISGIDFSEQ